VDFEVLGLLLSVFYTPLAFGMILLSDRLVKDKESKAKGQRFEKARTKYPLLLSVFALWVLCGVICLFIQLENRWPYYLHAMFGGTRLLSYHIPLGILVGLALYYYELRVRIRIPIVKVFASRLISTLERKLSSTASSQKRMQYLELYSSNWIVLLMGITNILEEFVWRGFFITTASDKTGSVALAVILSALVYASYHYGSGGIRNAFTHGRNGIIFAILFVLTGDLVVPFIAHATFNVLAVRGLRKMLPRLQYGYQRPPNVAR